MPDLTAQLAANLAAVQQRIAEACAAVGRDPAAVQLVAVVKSAAWDWVRGLVELGVQDLAESRPQQLVERAERLATEVPAANVRWHMIGHLQRNKVRPVLPVSAVIHSVDSLRLAERIAGIAAELGLRPDILLEVNVSGEASKNGFTLAEIESAWETLAALPHVQIRGLMTMAPLSEDPEASRPTFRGLRAVRERLRARGPLDLPELSMGMSGDFETAVQEGATLVRIGTRLFEGLA